MNEYFEGTDRVLYLASEKKMLAEWEVRKNNLNLNSIFASKNFLKSIKALSEITANTGYESGTKVYFKDDGTWAAAGATTGETASYQSDTFINDAKELYLGDPESIYKAKLKLVGLHFHPYNNAEINPSFQDLSSLLEEKKEAEEKHKINGFDPIEIIAQIDDDGIIHLLVIQDKITNEEKMLKLEQIIRRTDYDQKTVLKLLSKSGFSTELLHSGRNGNFPQKELNKLNKFKFTG